ncbi:MAG: protein-(glutamine-N5) methyltransferase, release factor-specific [Gammaproteobacteria bacterium 39-13]|nr:peptide chain release factor N(5)-glutamine methyltransferase [Gammaproteobacteria bacterium]OJV89820.1 MAG: protein-(glutamine-N5) methyltransferase, release factor-specific [Gammaproteobacteria bacterium 39-13]
MTTIAELLEWAKEALIKHDVPQLEAQVLLAYVLGCDRAYLYAWPEKEVSEENVKQFEAIIRRREQHEPIAYLVGNKEFWSLAFKVSKDTLIPRADTELLVQTVLDNLPQTMQSVVDVGTGCGIIACTLAHQRPNWQVYGVDISAQALEIARINAHDLHISNVEFIESNWLQNLKGKSFDAIIGNPPYIREGDVHLIHGDLLYEPKIALTPGPTGLEAFQIILSQCPFYLKPKGLIAFEHGFDQADKVAELLTRAGFENIKTFQDFSGNQRVTIGRFSS